MKRMFSLILAFIIMLSLCACEGNFCKVNLQNAIEIPENGIIKESVIKQIKSENAIGIFTGESGGFHYEWTIFGSDVEAPKQVNLAVSIDQNQDGELRISLEQEEEFGFSGLLSIHLTERWEADSATAYRNERAVASVSLTGSKNKTILNCILDGSLGAVTIKADTMTQENTIPEEEMTVSTGATDSSDAGGDYLSDVKGSDDQVYSDGKDKYLTDPVPAGKPKPVEPEDQEVNKGKAYTCTFSIECSTILNNLDMLDPDKLEMVPSGGVILAKTTVTFYEGESVFDVLQRLCKEKGIHMEASWTPIYNSAYVEGIHNLYEFDCGALSGWMYRVNGWYPNYGCSRYQLKAGDVVQWRYTCDLGNDVGGGYAVGG